jgi:hypothetical protein
MLTRNGIGRWGGLAFVFGNVLFLVNKFNEMRRLFRTLFALGLIGMGLTLWLEKPARANPV